MSCIIFVIKNLFFFSFLTSSSNIAQFSINYAPKVSSINTKWQNKILIFFSFKKKMNKILLILIFGLTLSLSNAIDQNEWNLFKEKCNKIYKNRVEELYRYLFILWKKTINWIFGSRFEIWKNNSKLIEEHNEKAVKGNSTFFLGVNCDSDLVRTLE